jgi:predicted XRE-type DNA-binding protein
MPKAKKRYHRRERKNLELRAWIMSNGVSYKEIAKRIYMSQSGLSQWFQNDMQKWQIDEVVQAVKEIVLERGMRDEEGNRREDCLYSPLVGSITYGLDSILDKHIEDEQ